MKDLVSTNRNPGHGMMDRTSPWHNLNSMLDRLFNDDSFIMKGLSQNFKVDVLNNEKEYIVKADLPGVKKEDAKITYNDNTFTISIHKGESKEEKDEKEHYIHRERSCTSMSRSMYLDNIDADGIKAKLEEGVLTVTLPKSENVKNEKQITIE